jgi:Pilus assembly protein, PilO
MINFRDRADAGPSLANLIAILVMVGTLVFMLTPTPTTKGLDKQANKQRLATRIARKKAMDRLVETNRLIVGTTWAESEELVGTESLKQITTLATKRKLKVAAFRPQRTLPLDALEAVPFTVTVEGPFTDVLGFERDVENSQTKLTVNLVQLSSSDPNSDRVTANVGVLAYLRPKPPASLAELERPAPKKSGSQKTEKTKHA